MSETVGNAFAPGRTLEPMPSPHRRKCWCGEKETHYGAQNGVGLMGGCEWHVRMWVRDAVSYYEARKTQETDPE